MSVQGFGSRFAPLPAARSMCYCSSTGKGLKPCYNTIYTYRLQSLIWNDRWRLRISLRNDPCSLIIKPRHPNDLREIFSYRYANSSAISQIYIGGHWANNSVAVGGKTSVPLLKMKTYIGNITLTNLLKNLNEERVCSRPQQNRSVWSVSKSWHNSGGRA